MKVLAIDCSAKSVSAAIADNGRLIAEGFLNIKLTHSETLMPIINQVLENSRLTLKDIDAFAVTAGPGSFTGIRIGISAIKGMAFADEKPVYAFSTLDSMALAFNGDLSFEKIICGLMDARRNQVYTAIYKNGVRQTEDMLIPCDELKEMLKEYDCPIYFTGDGYDLAKKLIDLPGVVDTPVRLRLQSAVSVALEGIKCYNENKNIFTDTEVMPIYLRASQAERERLERIQNNE